MAIVHTVPDNGSGRVAHDFRKAAGEVDHGTVITIVKEVEAKLFVSARQRASLWMVQLDWVGCKPQAETPAPCDYVKGMLCIVGHKAGDESVDTQIFVPFVNVQEPKIRSPAQFLVGDSHHHLPAVIPSVTIIIVAVVVSLRQMDSYTAGCPVISLVFKKGNLEGVRAIYHFGITALGDGVDRVGRVKGVFRKISSLKLNRIRLF